MLARPNRITLGTDYRRVARATRIGCRGLVVHGALRDNAAAPTRFGFIITKRVGVAVVRNTIRRRLKAICRELLVLVPTGYDFVIRVHPEAAEFGYDDLRERTRYGVLALVDRLGPASMSEQCSCGDEP